MRVEESTHRVHQPTLAHVRVRLAAEDTGRVTRIVIVGGGPAGYEAALVAAQLAGEVTVVEPDGLGGACVLYDCVPSKTLIATSETMTQLPRRAGAGRPHHRRTRRRVGRGGGRRRRWSTGGSRTWPSGSPRTSGSGWPARGCGWSSGRGRFAAEQPAAGRRIEVVDGAGRSPRRWMPTWCCSPPARPRGCCRTRCRTASASSPGARSTTWPSCPSTSSWSAPGSPAPSSPARTWRSASRVTLVSSRHRVLPGEDTDAAEVIEEVFAEHGGAIVKQARAASVRRVGEGRRRHHGGRPHGRGQPRADDRRLGAQHRAAWRWTGSASRLDARGFIEVDRVSRTTAARASTRRATAPACSCSPRWRPCRAGSRCGTRSARRSPRCG